MNPRSVLKLASIALAISLVSVEAQAISRYNSTSMSCASIQARVHAEGAILLRWRSKRNPSLPLGGRFVRSSGFCDLHLHASTTYVPSSDRKSCPVRKCKRLNSFEEKYRFFRFRRH